MISLARLVEIGLKSGDACEIINLSVFIDKIVFSLLIQSIFTHLFPYLLDFSSQLPPQQFLDKPSSQSLSKQISNCIDEHGRKAYNSI